MSKAASSAASAASSKSTSKKLFAVLLCHGPLQPGQFSHIHNTSTRSFAINPAHPHHIKTVRRLESVNPDLLHWHVFIPPPSLSKLSTVRKWAATRVRRAFIDELKNMGWNKDGSIRKEGDKYGRIQDFSLMGQLGIRLVTDDHALTATPDEVRDACTRAIRFHVVRQKRGFQKQVGRGLARKDSDLD